MNIFDWWNLDNIDWLVINIYLSLFFFKIYLYFKNTPSFILNNWMRVQKLKTQKRRQYA